VVEEYCWAITQEAGRSCCVRSFSSVLEFGFKLVSLASTYVYVGRGYILKITGKVKSLEFFHKKFV
jgi:hypothetical protein